MKRFIFPTLTLLLFAACEKKPETVEVSEASIREHVKTLASDDFQGRKPFTEGETKTLDYLVSQLKSLGIEPGNGDSYFQEVPMVELTAVPSETMTVSGGLSNISLQLSTDFVVYSERVIEEVNLENSELVFAGYGVVAPEYDRNDYEGLDVKGKTVVVLVNDPGFGSGDSTLFKGETMTYYGRWTYKFEEAARQGAAGCLIVHQTVPAGYPWAVVQNSWSGASLFLDQSNGAYQLAVQGWITREAAIELFKTSGKEIDNFNELARSRDFRPMELGISASVSVKNVIKKSVSQNVVGKITGIKRPEETIIYSAHWDHLGIGLELDGDSIYNGAHDNATGSAGLLAIAEAFSKSSKPDRTAVFLWVTAEEQGLLGSKFYADNPIYDVKKTVANINMDGLPYIGKMKDLTIVGYGQSEMDDIATRLAEKQGRYVIPDPEPGKGYFFRSDHFHFARVGIPPLYASGKYEHWDKGVEYAQEKSLEFLTNAYHKPADEYDESWDMSGAWLDAQLMYEIGRELGNSETWPKWKEGSEFKTMRDGN
jgi:Zn-dependent M28 family amino/carboxypeptidase